MLSVLRFPGLLLNACGPRPCTSGPRWRRLLSRSELSAPTGPSCFWVNRRFSTRAEPQLASIPPGPPATYLTLGQKTVPNQSNARSHVSLRISAIAFWHDPFPHPQCLSGGTQIGLAGTCWGHYGYSDTSSSVPHPTLSRTPGPIFISAEHPLPLVAVSTEWPAIMPLPRRLRIRLVNWQLVRFSRT